MKSQSFFKSVCKNTILFVAFICFFVISISLLSCTNKKDDNNGNDISVFQQKDGYTMESSTILARHNLRAFLDDWDDMMPKITTHKWDSFGCKYGDLAQKGSDCEKKLGEFFSKFYKKCGLIPDNWTPKNDETRFLSNTFQRTTETAKSFAQGLIPSYNVDIKYNVDQSQKDPMFFGALPKLTDEQKSQIKCEISECFGNGGITAINRTLDENYKVVENILDFKDSEYAKQNNIDKIPRTDQELEFSEGSACGAFTGSLPLSFHAADAIISQWFLQDNNNKVDWLNEISEDNLSKLTEIYDSFIITLTGSKTASTKIATPMIKEILNDINNSNRKLSFLSGQDTSIRWFLTAIGAEDYKLPNSIYKYTPFGLKLCMDKYKKDEKEYVNIYFVYPSDDQLKNNEEYSENNPPQFYNINIKGISRNNDGLYSLDDFNSLLNETIINSSIK